MTSTIERPIFAEGEVLHANDLNAGFYQERARNARHVRQSHRWGIIEGLELKGESTATGFQVTLTKGAARDVRGREIIIPDDVPISLNASLQVRKNDDRWFPVFIYGEDEQIKGNQLNSICSNPGGSHLSEGFQYIIGRPEETDVWESSQICPGVEEGPDVSNGQYPAKVLVGFVQLEQADLKPIAFKAVAIKSPAKVMPRYAGLRGQVLESPDSSVSIQIGQSAQDNALTLKFNENSILSLSKTGDLRIEGQLITSVTTKRHFSSGIAFDGVKIPLPTGVEEKDLDSFHLHLMLTPLLPDLSDSIMLASECRVDDQRQVCCLVRFLSENGKNSLFGCRIPWAASYLLALEPKGEQ